MASVLHHPATNDVVTIYCSKCQTQTLRPRRASKTCMSQLCSGCCITEYLEAMQGQHFRDECAAHSKNSTQRTAFHSASAVASQSASTVTSQSASTVTSQSASTVASQPSPPVPYITHEYFGIPARKPGYKRNLGLLWKEARDVALYERDQTHTLKNQTREQVDALGRTVTTIIWFEVCHGVI